MRKLEHLSDNDIKELITKMQKGLNVASPGSEEAKVLQVSIDRALEELSRRAAKKSEGQPAAQAQPKNQGVKSQEPAKEKSDPEKHKTHYPLPAEKYTPGSAKPQTEPAPVLLADMLTKAPPRSIKVQWVNGEIREMTDLELRRKSKDNFSDVLKSKFKLDELRRSVQFNNCVIFLVALYKLGGDFPEHIDLHPTYNQCGAAMQTRSMELYVQIKENWEKYKDLDN